MTNFTVVSDGSRLKDKTKDLLSGNFRVSVLADAAGTFVFDTMSITRLGLNFEWSLQWISWSNPTTPASGTMTVYGTTDSRNKILRPNQWPNIMWTPAVIATLTVGQSFNVSPGTWSGLKLVFPLQGEARFLAC